MTGLRDIGAPNLSVAWVRALEAALALPGHAAVHVTVRVEDPAPEVPEIRTLADELMRLGGVRSIDTVSRTIFPATWAARHPDPATLAAHYRAQYPTIRRFEPNRRGTYFGRVVAYPMGEDEDPFDQLTDLVDKLRTEMQQREGRARARRLSSRYEVNIWKPGDLPGGMRFPCMAHMSFHMVNGQLHLAAYYRNQYLVERAYGNYLGLARLQQYVASAVELKLGELMVVAGHVSLDTPNGINVTVIRELLSAAREHLPPTNDALASSGGGSGV